MMVMNGIINSNNAIIKEEFRVRKRRKLEEKKHMDKTEKKYQQCRFETYYIKITLKVSGLTFQLETDFHFL